MLQYINKLVKKLKTSEKGQGMVEYALIIAFVAAIALFVLNGGLRESVSGAFQKAQENVNAATDGATPEDSTSGNSGNSGSDNGGGNG